MAEIDIRNLPSDEVTFTINAHPTRQADRKTIQRLMQMQPDVQKGLKKLQHLRKTRDNRTYIRAGVEWTDRKRATRLTRVEPGQSFTLRVTPQIARDINSVGQYLDTK